MGEGDQGSRDKPARLVVIRNYDFEVCQLAAMCCSLGSACGCDIARAWIDFRFRGQQRSLIQAPLFDPTGTWSKDAQNL